MHSFPGFSRLRMHTKGGSPVAFVEYQDVRYAAQAMATLQGSFLLSSDRGAIRIEYAKSKMAEVGFTNLWIEVGFILCYASRYRHPVHIPTKTQRPCATHPLRYLDSYLDFCQDVSPISTPYLVDQRHPCDHREYSLALSLSFLSRYFPFRPCDFRPRARHQEFLYGPSMSLRSILVSHSIPFRSPRSLAAPLFFFTISFYHSIHQRRTVEHSNETARSTDLRFRCRTL